MIGSARGKTDGTLVVRRVAESNQGCTILRHVGPLSQGEGRVVHSWSETAGRQNSMDDKTLLTTMEAQLKKAGAEMVAGNWKAANKRLNEALGELGDRYRDSKVVDDFNMKLLAACLQERDDKPDHAAQVRRRILAERLDLLRGKIH